VAREYFDLNFKDVSNPAPEPQSDAWKAVGFGGFEIGQSSRERQP
jgi:hypothetical protein